MPASAPAVGGTLILHQYPKGADIKQNALLTQKLRNGFPRWNLGCVGVWGSGTSFPRSLGQGYSSRRNGAERKKPAEAGLP